MEQKHLHGFRVVVAELTQKRKTGFKFSERSDIHSYRLQMEHKSVEQRPTD